MAKKTTRAPAGAGRARGDVLKQALEAARLLAQEPRRPGDLAEKLRCSRRSVERILRTFEAEGLDVRVEREGGGAWYRLEPADAWTAALSKRKPV